MLPGKWDEQYLELAVESKDEVPPTFVFSAKVPLGTFEAILSTAEF